MLWLHLFWSESTWRKQHQLRIRNRAIVCLDSDRSSMKDTRSGNSGRSMKIHEDGNRSVFHYPPVTLSTEPWQITIFNGKKRNYSYWAICKNYVTVCIRGSFTLTFFWKFLLIPNVYVSRKPDGQEWYPQVMTRKSDATRTWTSATGSRRCDWDILWESMGIHSWNESTTCFGGCFFLVHFTHSLAISKFELQSLQSTSSML